MVNKALVTGIIGFILGGLVVSTAAVTLDDDQSNNYSKKSTSENNKMMMSNLQALKGDDFDRAFIDEMIMHHQGAIDMAILTETKAKHSEIKQLGKDIMAAQSREIDMMQTWQTDWGYKSTPNSHMMR
jgi:uncharacterized protein (DUF305 family)